MFGFIQEIAKDEGDVKEENELIKKLEEMEERASELDRRRSGKISIITYKMIYENYFLIFFVFSDKSIDEIEKVLSKMSKMLQL